MNEPEELSDVAMSDQNTPTEAQEEESSGILSLEAKAGLTLICLLAAAFSYMVWQKWKEMDHSQAADEQDRPAARKEENPEGPPHDVKEKLELADQVTGFPADNDKPAANPLHSGESDNSTLPLALNPRTPGDEPSEDTNPFADSDNEPARRPANIPTLEAPAETDSISAAESSDNFDPFGNEFEAVPEKTREEREPPTTAEGTPQDEFDPFGPETGTEESATSQSAESSADNELTESEADPFAADPEPKPAADKPDSLATAPDPFTESQPEPSSTETETPTLDFADSKPLPEEKPEPVKTVEADPFGEEPAEKHPLAAASEKPVKVTPGDSYQEPLPLLEPVPDQESKTPAPNPFGEYESVPAGAAQASSVTQVAPDPSASKRSGTLADLDGPASTTDSTTSHSSPFEESPFANPQPKPIADKFQRNPDGTYEIRQGDSYWIISRKAYGSSRYFRALAEYNRKVIADPQQMKAGKKIVIPPVQELERRLAHLIPETPAAPKPSIVMASAEREAGFFTDEEGNPMYRVQENDTLTGISQRHLGRSSRWIQIYELNRDKLSNPNQLKIGTTLKLPGDASRVRIVRGQ
jgi:nucleoid-associated protein YgaU